MRRVVWTVHAAVEQRQGELDRIGCGGLDDQATTGPEPPGKQFFEVGSKAARESIGRVAEDEVVGAPIAAEEADRIGANDRAALAEAERRRRSPPRTPTSVSTSVADAAPRESASIATAPVPANRSRTIEAVDVAEDREQRLADPVVVGPDRVALRRRRSACPRALPRRRASSGGDRLGPLVAEAFADGGERAARARGPRAFRTARRSRSGRRAPRRGSARPREARRSGTAAGRSAGCRAPRPRRAGSGRPRRARSRRARGRRLEAGCGRARSPGRRRGCIATRARRGRSDRGADGAG